MDRLDKSILCILERNSRTPTSQIAKNLRRNRNVITYRIKKLKREGIIKNYITSINLGKFGYNTYKIYFKIHRINKENELVDHLKNKKEIIHLIRLEGEYDLSCVVVAEDVVGLDDFLIEMKTKFRDVIKDLHVSIVVYSRIFKFEKLLLGQKEETIKIEKYSSKEAPIKLDDTDKKILRVLSQNANISYVDLMEKTKLSLDTVKYRMKKLKEHVISSFRLLFDLNKLGYFHYVILLKTDRMKRHDERKLVSWLTMRNNVMYCTKRIGEHDFEINLAISNINNLRETINDLHLKFSEVIDTYDTVLVSKVLKLNYIPF